MTYMASLSETRKQAADVLLECKEGKSLPCHYLLLESASRTLAGLGELVRREEDGKTKIPMEEVSEVVHAFLSWVYTHKITFEAPMAYRLAYLAHRLDSPGLLQACDWLLADQAKNGGLLAGNVKALESAGKSSLDCIDWAELAGICGLPKLSAICIEYLIQDEKDWGERLENLSGKILSPVLKGIHKAKTTVAPNLYVPQPEAYFNGIPIVPVPGMGSSPTDVTDNNKLRCPGGCRGKNLSGIILASGHGKKWYTACVSCDGCNWKNSAIWEANCSDTAHVWRTDRNGRSA